MKFFSFKKKTKPELPNSVVLSRRRTEFKYVDPKKLPPDVGDGALFVNNSKRYHLLKEEGKKLSRLVLPDGLLYYSPVVFGEIVLQMPAHKKLFERRQSLLEKLSPLFLIGGIVAVGIALIVVGGN